MASKLQAPRRPTNRSLNQHRSFRSFYITVLLLSAFAIISLAADQAARYRHGPHYGAAQRRALEQLDPGRLVKRDVECRLVHHADDKCAFIQANCPDEEAGIFSYLSLYYCSLSNAKPLAFILLVLWLGALFSTIGLAASDFFSPNLQTIASTLGMSQAMAGVTFLAIGNGSPDVFSTFAAMNSNSGSLAIGELIGAACFISAVVAGSMGIVREFRVGRKSFVRDAGFFVVATSFSMMFLADGELHLWECCVMIAFYLFYVVVVIVWHWYLGQRRKRRERDAAARGQYLSAPNEEVEALEEDDDEDAPTGPRHTYTEDFEALERGPSPGFGLDGESDDDEEMHIAAEIASNMRLARPTGNRRNTMTPIRPSLIGVLEFRAVLSNLQRARSSHAWPIHLRRYSDDPAADQVGGPTSHSVLYSHDPDVVVTRPDDSPGNSPRADGSARARAVSMNDAGRSGPLNPAAFTVANIPDSGIAAATPTFPRHLHVPGDGTSISTVGSIPPSPSLSVTPPVSQNGNLGDSSTGLFDGGSFNHPPEIWIPEDNIPSPQHLNAELFKSTERAVDLTLDSSRRPRGPSRKRATQIPRLDIPTSSRDSSRSRTMSPVIQFPAYTDSARPISSSWSNAPSLVLPESTFSPESVYISDDPGEQQQRPIRWWPYSSVPSPRALMSELCPVLLGWREKDIWSKIISVLSAPSVFLLTVTLPVVDCGSPEEPEEDVLVIERRRRSTARTRSSTVPLLTLDSPSLVEEEPEWASYRRATDTRIASGNAPRSTAEVAVSAENPHNPHAEPLLSEYPLVKPDASLSQDWKRWLVVVQLFTAPLFVSILIWANTDERNLRFLLQLLSYSLLGSLVLFGILVLTTTPDRPPKYHVLLCFLGFIVAIAWISTIANEVVGVLKTFGVILGISDAILGLTIFAVGNSLGDLVANMTVARIGYPVMALSACFGGPMMNILLGVGVSGMYMTIKEANKKHDKHPGKPIKYKPYLIDVSGTLLVSGISLLVTLVVVLIAVPMNKWVMSRKIGWGLIALWGVSTAVNLAVEFSGAWDAALVF